MTDSKLSWRTSGIAAAITAAVLFGAGTPFAKLLLDSVNPWLLAGLLYLGSGIGLSTVRLFKRAPPVYPSRADWPWLAGAILVGGVIAPVLLMFGLIKMPASGASLLLNAEGVFTALLAWCVFRENFDRRIAAGMAAIVLGAVVVANGGVFFDCTIRRRASCDPAVGRAGDPATPARGRADGVGGLAARHRAARP